MCVRERTDAHRFRSQDLFNVDFVDQLMCAQPSEEFHQRRACAFLARESQVPLDEVTRLYEVEWARLALDARLTSYLGILTVRNVRARLRARHRAARSPGAALDSAREVPGR